jgi:hypothetical protein
LSLWIAFKKLMGAGKSGTGILACVLRGDAAAADGVEARRLPPR